MIFNKNWTKRIGPKMNFSFSFKLLIFFLFLFHLNFLKYILFVQKKLCVVTSINLKI